MKQPVCTIVAGPNGAGKTTFALNYLPEYTHCHNFVNADMIAAGLSPLSPQQEWLRASRLFLKAIQRCIDKQEDFCFETTLSGKTYLHLINQLSANGWRVELCYLWLPSVETSIQRVAERVKHGGHDIPTTAIIRRYSRSINNLLNHYAPLCDNTVCFENSERTSEVIFTQNKTRRTINNPTLFNQMLRIIDERT